ncbi:MAG: helix-turn-helix domain-containing protein, partial [Rhodoferax sp.]
MHYTHLTQDERYQIAVLRHQGLSCAHIAREL